MRQVYQVKSTEEGMLLRDFLALKISAKALKRIKRNGKIYCNGVERTVRYTVQKGDCITLILPEEVTKITPQNIPFSIYYEDDDYLVVYKPARMPCIPTKRYPDKTLANAIMYYYKQKGINATIHLVNRLDKDTKGLLVVAKHSHAHALLSRDIKQVRRVYRCLVEGHLEGSGTICAPIIKAQDSLLRKVDDSGKEAITHYQSCKHFKNTTLVTCHLETGRTHQIRVHMKHIGHPLVNDALYGNPDIIDFYLESKEVSFIQPITKKEIHIYIP